MKRSIIILALCSLAPLCAIAQTVTVNVPAPGKAAAVAPSTPAGLQLAQAAHPSPAPGTYMVPKVLEGVVTQEEFNLRMKFDEKLRAANKEEEMKLRELSEQMQKLSAVINARRTAALAENPEIDVIEKKIMEGMRKNLPPTMGGTLPPPAAKK